MPPRRLPSPVRLAPLLAGLFFAAPALAPAAPQPPAAAAPFPDTASPADLLALLTDPASAPATRDRAAQRLCAVASQRDALDAIRVHLASADPAAPSTTALFRAAARSTTPLPAELFDPFTALLSRARAEQLPTLLPALSAWRTREALRVLLAYTDPNQPGPVRDAAFQALQRLTGRDDLGADPERWDRFSADAAAWSREEWERRLLLALAARADALAAREAAALARVTDALRRLYLATPVEQRSDLLVSLLRDDSDPIRSLGLELASRELSSTHLLDQPVADACLTLLNHPTPRIRQNAALLLYQLSPPGAGPAISAALLRETDTDAAAALLSASGRWPDPAVIPTVAQWLGRPATRAAAAQAALALARAGHLYDPAPRAVILDAIHAIPAADLPPAAGPLLIILGDDVDRRAAASLLRSPSAGLRAATADAAVVYPELLPDLIAAAADDPQLWDAAVRAATMHDAAAPMFARLAQLPAPTPDARRDGLRFIASVMPAAQLIEAAGPLSPDDPLRELLLTPLLDPARRMSLNPEAVSYPATIRGLLDLSQIRLATDRPDEALLALDATPDPIDPGDQARLNRLRTMTLLALNRADQAADLAGAPEDWLDALEAHDPDAALPGLLEAFAAKFPALSPANQARYDALRAKADALPRPAPANLPPS